MNFRKVRDTYIRFMLIPASSNLSRRIHTLSVTLIEKNIKKDYNLNVRQKHDHTSDEGLLTSEAHTKNQYMYSDLAICLWFMLLEVLNWFLLLLNLTFFSGWHSLVYWFHRLIFTFQFPQALWRSMSKLQKGKRKRVSLWTVLLLVLLIQGTTKLKCTLFFRCIRTCILIFPSHWTVSSKNGKIQCDFSDSLFPCGRLELVI